MKFRLAMSLMVVIIALLGYLAFGQDSGSRRSHSSGGSTQNDSFKNFKMP